MVRVYPTPEQIKLHNVEPGLHWSLLDANQLIGSEASVATQKDLLYEAIEAQGGKILAEIELPIRVDGGEKNQKLILVESQEAGVVNAVEHIPDSKSLELFPIDENADGPKWYPVSELPIGNAEETVRRLNELTFAIRDQNAHIICATVGQSLNQDGKLTSSMFFRIESYEGHIINARSNSGRLV